jgi:uncharacterized protein YlzI (FlbEa/FlbD family)
MNKCTGVMGYFFGHNYQSFILETEPAMDIEIDKMNGNYFLVKNYINNVIEKLTKKKFIVLCKRCGHVKKEI